MVTILTGSGSQRVGVESCEALIVRGCRMLCINVYLLFVAHVKDYC